MNVPAIIALTSEHALDSHHVGFKAARLAAMARAGFPVPPGFVVGVEVLNRCSRQANSIRPPGNSGSGATPAAVSGDILPEDIQTVIGKAAAALGAKHLAVRSSGMAEDGEGFSMAGQFDTFLNTPPAMVAAKVGECWASIFGAAPAAYRRKLAAADNARMGVIVQTQIEARWAGVVFSVDPVSKSADRFVIEWVAGLGDRLVSGQVAPHRIFVRRDHPEIPANLSAPLAETLKQVWEWTRKAERLFQHPIDMEWAADDRGVHVLQARPVTGLATEETVVWTNVNMAENFPHPLTPMAWSLVDRFYSAYMRAILRKFDWQDTELARAAHVIDNLTGVQAGRVYYNLNNWYAVMHFFPCHRWLIRFLNHYIGQKIPFQYQPKKDATLGIPARRRWLAALLFWPRMGGVIFGAARSMDRFEPDFFQERRTWRQVPYDQLTAGQLLARLNSLLDFVDHRWTPPAMADMVMMILPGLFDVLTRRWLPDEAGTVALQAYQGLDLISIQPSVLIWEAARRIKADARLRSLLAAGDYAELVQVLPDGLRSLVAEFMERFGGRCFHDCMLVAPTFEERHDLFWDLVRSYLNSAVDHPQHLMGQKRRQREVYTQSLLQRLNIGQRMLYRRILGRAQQAVRLRERGRLLQSLLFGEMRQMVLALGRQLQAKAVLAETEDIFYLHLDEVHKLLEGKFQFPETLEQIITARRKAWSANGQIEPPAFFFMERGDIARPAAVTAADSQQDDVLTGTAVSGGRTTACARVILDPLQGSKLPPGDILVTRATDPGWTPLFSMAGGLVLEHGGLLSHGAIVAREFGIPAVVGVQEATRKIDDGQLVALDGYAGTVRLMS